MIPCNKCGTLNRDGSKFCNNCGERLRVTPGGSTLPANGIVCPKCGTLNQVENVFCSNCGTHLVPLSGSGQTDQPSAPPPIKGLSLPTKSASPLPASEPPAPGDAVPGEPSEPGEPTLDDTMPEWLRNLHSAAPSAESADIDETASESEESLGLQESASSDEIPDWLARLRAAPPVSDEEQPLDTETSAGEAPDWIRALQQEPPDQEAATPGPAQQMPEPGEIVEPSTPFDAAVAPAELPSWIEQLPSDAESEDANPLNADDFAAQLETMRAAIPPADEIPPDAESDDIPDWLRMAAGAGESLPAAEARSGQEQSLAGEPSQAQTEPHAPEPAGAEQPPASEPVPAPVPPGQLPTWVAALKPEGVEEEPGTPGTFETEPAETTGPLAGLRGVLPLAVSVAEPHLSTKPSKPLEQESAAHIFDAILAEPVAEHEAPVPTVKPRRMGSRRWIYLLLALVVVLPFLLPVSLAGSLLSISNVPPAALHDVIEGLQPGSTVLVAFDYDPSMTGEMDLVANAIVRDLVRRKVRIIAVSTLETGPQIAQRVLDSAAAAGQNYRYGSEYVNLGYLPGHEAGLAQLATTGLPADSRDFVQGRSLDQFPGLASVKRLQDTQLVIELAGSEQELKSWMEQVQPRAGVRIAAGVSAGVEPKARAYLGAGQLSAMLSGLIGAARYEILSRSEGLAVTSVDAQSAAMLFLVLLVVVGNIVFWVSRARGKA